MISYEGYVCFLRRSTYYPVFLKKMYAQPPNNPKIDETG